MIKGVKKDGIPLIKNHLRLSWNVVLDSFALGRSPESQGGVGVNE
jgi:hypothetical protein